MLRRVYLPAALILALAPAVWAQEHRVEITPFFGYTFSEGFTIDPVTIGGATYNKVNPVSGINYGASIDFFVTENVQVGFQIAQQDSAIEGKGTTTREFADLKVRNYHGIFTYNFADEDEPIRPFIFGGLGATQYVPGEVQGQEISGNTKFSSTWGGGVKAYAGPNFGIRVSARWTPTYIKSEASGIWCSPWWPWGCYVLSEADYSNQFELAGGVVFRF